MEQMKIHGALTLLPGYGNKALHWVNTQPAQRTVVVENSW